MQIESQVSLRRLNTAFNGLLRADGKAWAAIRENGVANVRFQQLDDSAGRKITNFTSEEITDIQMAGTSKFGAPNSDSDVVLLHETKP